MASTEAAWGNPELGPQEWEMPMEDWVDCAPTLDDLAVFAAQAMELDVAELTDYGELSVALGWH